ncbi:PPOX class F420-dependent oxidoreductase [Nocardia nova]|uniref:PPOX class F420-dependent oxidoreductase n=1 Tax=Nocardia nova TaxID=37330 RepID=UPI0009DEC75C
MSTFRKDGSGVGSPVWVAEESGRLFVWTETNSHRFRCLRANPSVTVQPCSFRGAPLDVVISGHPKLLDDSGTARVRMPLAHKYLAAYSALTRSV